MNNSKRKLLSTIGSLALVLVIAVGGVIGALAALSANVQSTFSISYTAHNVHAIITGDYADSTGTQVGNLVDSEDEDTQIVFNGNEGDSAKKGFQSENFKILGPNDHMDVHYIVQNTGENPFGLKMEFTGDLAQSNMQVRYSVQYWNGTDPKPAYNFNQQTLAEMYLTEAGTDKCCAVVGMRFSVVDEVKDATLDATMNFDLDSNAEKPAGPIEMEMTGNELSNFLYDNFSDMTALTFDKYTKKDEYNIDGQNKIANYKEKKQLQEGVDVYSNQDNEVYVLYNGKLVANEDMSYLLAPTKKLGYRDLPIKRFDELKSIVFKNFDTSHVVNMQGLFARQCELYEDGDWAAPHLPTPLDKLDTQCFETNNVTDMSYMYANLRIEELDVSNFNTQNVLTMKSMFSNSTFGADDGGDLKTSIIGLDRFNTSQVKDMSDMFGCCDKLSSLDIEGWDTHSVTNMSIIFDGCELIELLDLSNWDTSSVIDMKRMFTGCYALTTIYVGDGWDVSNVQSSDSMFWACSELVGGAGTSYSAMEEKDSNNYDYYSIKYACVDEGPDSEHPGYLTHIRDKKN